MKTFIHTLLNTAMAFGWLFIWTWELWFCLLMAIAVGIATYCVCKHV